MFWIGLPWVTQSWVLGNSNLPSASLQIQLSIPTTFDAWGKWLSTLKVFLQIFCLFYFFSGPTPNRKASLPLPSCPLLVLLRQAGCKKETQNFYNTLAPQRIDWLGWFWSLDCAHVKWGKGWGREGRWRWREGKSARNYFLPPHTYVHTPHHPTNLPI